MCAGLMCQEKIIRRSSHVTCWLRLVVVFSLVVLALLPARVFGAFGVTSSGGFYTMDTGVGLVFKVDQSNGDITSLNFNGVEYQSTSKKSQIASGLGSATVTATTYGNNYIKITINSGSANTVVTNLTHYLMVRNGFPIIYMATYVVDEPTVGELRWITRLQYNKLPHGPPQSDNNGNTGAIESTDVFGYADGHSTSKYYGRHRAMELTYTGATNNGVGVFIVFDTRESSSGGPFYRDIENQGDGAGSDQEVYNYMNSGHEEPEAWRLGGVLCGPYALVFTTGAPPNLPIDYSWIETGGLNLLGWVSTTNRGTVSGVAYGIPAGFQGVVGFANTSAQYWAVVSTNGTYDTPLMKPDVYTAKLYKGELEVATNVVTVTAGQINILNFASSETAPASIFKIGEWDGTRAGFLNASNIINRHPSDIRNIGSFGTNWGPITYTAGVNTASDFPAIQMRGTNSPTTILFNLNSSQYATSQITGLTLRIGMTCAYNSGRPKPTVNSWTPSSNPSASSQPNSRSFTVGTWRGNNAVYSFNVPASAFVPGQNTVTIPPISGSGDLGPWLSAGWVYDAVELDVPNTSPAIPAAPTSLTATPVAGAGVNLTWADNATNEINTLVERSRDNVTFNLIAALTTGATNLTDTKLLPGTTYYYRIRASNAGGASAYSNVAGITTPPLQFDGISTTSAGIILSGNGGVVNGTYYVLTTTNLTTPLTNWTPIMTNQFDASGSFTITNPVSSSKPQQLYRLMLP
jgi:rhamnogalacturonan endolyase